MCPSPTSVTNTVKMLTLEKEIFLQTYFIYLFNFGCAGSSLLLGLSLVSEIGATLSLWCMDFSLPWLLLLQSMDCKVSHLQQLGHMGSRAQAEQLWCMGLIALQHVGSCWTRDQTHVPCISKIFTPEAPGKPEEENFVVSIHLLSWRLSRQFSFLKSGCPGSCPSDSQSVDLTEEIERQKVDAW